MNLTRTTWRPDTCGCEIVYEWDRDLPETERVHVPVSIINCPAHEKKEAAEIKFETIKEENLRKNVAVNYIVENHPDIKHEDIAFSFDATRTLNIETPKTIDKASVEASLKTLAGSQKIIVK